MAQADRATLHVHLCRLLLGCGPQCHFAARTPGGNVGAHFVIRRCCSRRDGLIAINLNDDDELVKVIETSGTDDIFMVAKSGMTIRFNEGDVRAMGRSAAGVRGMRLKTGDDAVVSCDVARDDTAILLMTEAGFGKRTQLDKFNTQGRGGQGVRGIKLTGKKGVVAAAFMVGIEDEIVAVSSGGVTIRMEVREISSQGRDATGVRIMNLDDGQTVASVAPIIAGE